MSHEKIWHIQNKAARLSDEELIALIKKGEIQADDYISNKDIKAWIKVKDSIYQFYLKENIEDGK